MLKKVLIIDDDPLIRNLIAALLRRKGFVASQAANGEEALTLLGSSRNEETGQSEFDLILLDLMMPKVSGWDVLSYIEQSLPSAVRNVVVISAAGEKQLEELERRGACGVILPKPFDTEAFYQKITVCIRGPYDPSSFDPGSDPHSTNDVA
jgi:CheY-like chemotaxis protein